MEWINLATAIVSLCGGLVSLVAAVLALKAARDASKKNPEHEVTENHQTAPVYDFVSLDKICRLGTSPTFWIEKDNDLPRLHGAFDPVALFFELILKLLHPVKLAVGTPVPSSLPKYLKRLERLAILSILLIWLPLLLLTDNLWQPKVPEWKFSILLALLAATLAAVIATLRLADSYLNRRENTFGEADVV